jgi:hypothetical protein
VAVLAVSSSAGVLMLRQLVHGLVHEHFNDGV